MTRNRVLKLIAERYSQFGISTDDKGYVKTPEHNLVSKFPNWNEIQLEIGGGNGSELKPNKYGRAKFCAAHSSSALCVNTFAEIKRLSSEFSFLNQTGFQKAQFERKFHTGISFPNLDFCIENDKYFIGLESKFVEPLSPKIPNQGNNLKKYVNRKDELKYFDSGFLNLINHYICIEKKLHLDVPQLIKHALGLKSESKNKDKRFKLVYIYWRPNNWTKVEAFCKHKEEIEDFKCNVNGLFEFHALSYQEFWEEYKDDDVFGNSIKDAKSRYNVTL